MSSNDFGWRPDGIENLGQSLSMEGFMAQQAAEAQRALDESWEAQQEGAAELEEQRQEAEARENRLAALAEAGEQRERRREVRERWMMIMTVAALVASVIAAVTGIIAIN